MAQKEVYTKEFYTVEEVSGLLRVQPLTIYRWVKSGKLKGYSLGRRLRFKQEDIDVFLESSRVGKGNVITVDFSNGKKDDSSA
jgi:excisionase family DNA binding protein